MNRTGAIVLTSISGALAFVGAAGLFSGLAFTLTCREVSSTTGYGDWVALLGEPLIQLSLGLGALLLVLGLVGLVYGLRALRRMRSGPSTPV